MFFYSLTTPRHDTAYKPQGDLPANLVLAYYYVRPRNSEGVTGLTPEAFSEQLRQVKAHYRIVGVDEFVARQAHEAGLALVTFDDAVLDQYQYAAPVLAEHNAPAVFYAPMRPIAEGVDFANLEAAKGQADPAGRSGWCTQHLLHALAQELGFARLETLVRKALSNRPGDIPSIDTQAMDRLYHYEAPHKRWLKYLMAFALTPAESSAVLHAVNAQVGHLDHRDWFCSAEQLRELQSAGHAIGAHGFDHLPYSTLSAAAQAADMRTAKGTMDRLLGARPRTIAFPFGRADETTYRLVAELGYTHSFTTAQRTDCAALPALLPTSTAAQPANV